MSYLYTPTPSWASSVTIPADSDAGRASGELATSIKTIANRNAWLAGQVTAETQLIYSDPTVVTGPFGNERIASITVDSTGCAAWFVDATAFFAQSVVYGGGTTFSCAVVINGTISDPESCKRTFAEPALNNTQWVDLHLFAASTVVGAAVPVVFHGDSSASGAANPHFFPWYRVTIFKVRS